MSVQNYSMDKFAAAKSGKRSFSRFFKSPLNHLQGLIHGQSEKPGSCMICPAGHPDIRRLAQIVGKLPIGETVALSRVREGLDANFKTVIADLNYMIFELRMPIEFSRRGILLKKPVHLCEDCARKAAA